MGFNGLVGGRACFCMLHCNWNHHIQRGLRLLCQTLFEVIMAGNSKPKRKKYRPKAIYKPMMANTRADIALDMHLAVEACISAPSPATFDQLGAMLASMATAVNQQEGPPIEHRGDDDSKAIVRMLKTLSSIQERFDRVGKYGVSEEEAEELRAAIGYMDSALARIPMNVMQASIYQVTQMCRGRVG